MESLPMDISFVSGIIIFMAYVYRLHKNDRQEERQANKEIVLAIVGKETIENGGN